MEIYIGIYLQSMLSSGFEEMIFGVLTLFLETSSDVIFLYFSTEKKENTK